jgi:hypothetical protein
MSAAWPMIRCMDGVLRSSLGQWQGYLSDAGDDADEADRRLAEVPAAFRPTVAAHLRSARVLHWVNEVLGCASLDGRRDMIQQCPPDLRDDVRDQVAILFDLRRTKAPKP